MVERTPVQLRVAWALAPLLPQLVRGGPDLQSELVNIALLLRWDTHIIKVTDYLASRVLKQRTAVEVDELTHPDVVGGIEVTYGVVAGRSGVCSIPTAVACWLDLDEGTAGYTTGDYTTKFMNLDYKLVTNLDNMYFYD